MLDITGKAWLAIMTTKKLAVKKRVYKIIQPHKSHDVISTIFDWFIASLIVINILIIIFDTLDLPPKLSSALGVIETATVIVFTIEYILRLWTADLIYRHDNPFTARLKYAFTFLMLMDFIAIVPFYLRFIHPIDINILRIFRLFRMIWFFRIKREYIKALSSIFDVFKRKAAMLFFSLIIIFGMMIFASVLMYNAEKHAQPEVFPNALSGLWWSVVAISTVGYGDIYPVTILGKIMAACFSILSIGLIAVPTGIISSGFFEKAREDRHAADPQKHFCPYCGKNIED
ncbi:MAG: ion transporter [Oscillospiraceae bacterium]|nr:ion transporter [Oscillospiraceae bacterium]